jgi:succinyl-diaminopimelate desuccinylase
MCELLAPSAQPLLRGSGDPIDAARAAECTVAIELATDILRYLSTDRLPAASLETATRRVMQCKADALVHVCARQPQTRSLAFLAAATKKIPGCKITVTKISENFSCFSQPTHPFFAAMASCVTRVRKQKTVFNVSTGFNDMHFFASHLKIPTLGYGPGGEDYHAIDERAQVKELVASAKIYAELLTTFVG